MDQPFPETTITTTKPKPKPRTRQLPPYHVLIENDDVHTFEFVIDVLCKVLAVTPQRAADFAVEAHTSGRAIVWTGCKEVAELKAEQLQTFHQILEDGRKLGPLGVLIEPAA